MNDFKLTFTLKQHTPIIHFQHDQHGATLRASEVKPKLDRYLIEKLGLTEMVADGVRQKEAPKREYKNWFNSEEHLSLDYKLKIEPNSEEKIEIKNWHENSPMYFANMGNKLDEKAKYKHFKFTGDEINCSIFSFNTKKFDNKNLLEVIVENLYSFFFQNNFGTRQSKGYGSFEVIKLDGAIVNEKQKRRYFNYQIALNNASTWEEALYQVSYFYKALRGGINLIDRQIYSNPIKQDNEYHLDLSTTSKYYIKPLVFLFAQSIGKQWDKKTIKQTYLGIKIQRKLNNSGNEKQQFINKFNLQDDYINKNKRDFFVNEIGLENQISKHNNSDVLSYESTIGEGECYFDFKDLFGLSSEESWRSYEKTIVKENIDKTSTTRSINSKNKIDSDYIDRFKSPILFKLIKENNTYKVFIIFSELPNEYIGSKFSVHPKTASSSLVLEIPSFKFQDLFDFIGDKTKFVYQNYLPELRYNRKNNYELRKYEEPEKINSVLTNFFLQIQKQSTNDTK